MDRFLSRLPSLETLLWVLASVTAFAALLFLAPAFLNSPSAATPAALQVADTPRPTLTPLPPSTPQPGVPAYRARTAVPMPSLPSGAQLYSFIADPTQSGWIASGDDKVHWGDRNLHAGFFKGQLYKSVLYFDINLLPPGSQLLAAQVELTGLNRGNIGAEGEWRLRLLAPDILKNWSGSSPSLLAGAAARADIGDPVSPADVNIDQVNPFVFGSDQLALIADCARTTGLIAFRIDGPSDSLDDLFTWDGAGLNLESGAHPVLRVAAVPGKFTVITNTPTPQNVLTAAAQLQTLTAFVGKFGTPTPFPRDYATATPVIYVTAQPTPANVQTRVAVAQYATAVAETTGTFTPTPSNWIVITPVPPTWTPGPTATPVAIPIAQLTPVWTPTVAPPDAVLLQTPIPNTVFGYPFLGNILFLSDRYDSPGPLLMRPDGRLLTQFTGMGYYYLAAVRDKYSPDHSKKIEYPRDTRDVQQLGIMDTDTGVITPVTNLASGIAYDGAWSPDGGRIAYISTEIDNRDEIFIYDLASRTSRRLTDNSGFYPDVPYVKHPSFSPDAKQILFESTRVTGRYQLWVMSATGTGLNSGMYNLSNSPWNDTDPVWIKP